MQGLIVCTFCRENGHRASKCPEMTDMFNDGFYNKQGGHGGHDHDDDERATASASATATATVTTTVVNTFTTRKRQKLGD